MSAWPSIRVLRAQPPGHAGTDSDRAAVFTAALEQSEQLMRAASDVGYAARPLPLFYSLSQAGRAIAAAYLDGPAWRLAGHGLRTDPKDTATDLLRRWIVPAPARQGKIASGRSDSFGAIAAAVGSDTLTAPIELGEVWAAVPELLPPGAQAMPGLDPEWRLPRVVFDEYEEASERMQGIADQLPFGLLVAGLPPGANATQLADELARYPAVTGAIPRTDPHLGAVGTPAEIVRGRSPYGQECVRIAWPTVAAPARPRIDDVAPFYRWTDVRLIHPRLANRDYVRPIMLWWLLLFGLSSIARYEPEMWVGALNVNGTPQAVPIETALDAALTAIPDLILLALYR